MSALDLEAIIMSGGRIKPGWPGADVQPDYNPSTHTHGSQGWRQGGLRPKDPKIQRPKDPKTQRPDVQRDYCQHPHTWQSRMRTRRVGQLGQDKGDKEVNKEIVGKLAPSATAYLSVSRITDKPFKRNNRQKFTVNCFWVTYIFHFIPQSTVILSNLGVWTSHWDLQRLRNTSFSYLALKTEGG